MHALRRAQGLLSRPPVSLLTRRRQVFAVPQLAVRTLGSVSHLLLPRHQQQQQHSFFFLGDDNRRSLSTQSRQDEDSYSLLGVDRGLTDHEYKVAYLKKARECHPDLHPDDPKATARFQSLSAAYDEIKTSGKRAAYGARRAAGHTARGAPPPNSAADAAATWAEAFDDASAMFEAAQVWWSDECAAVDQDAQEFMVAFNERRLGDALHIAQKHAGLVIGVAVPVLLLLRWPHAALALLRGAVPIVTFVLGGLAKLALRNPRLIPFIGVVFRQFGGGLWARAVARSRARIAEKRREELRAQQRRQKEQQQQPKR